MPVPVVPTPLDTPCVEHQGGRDHNGYGQRQVKAATASGFTTVKVHRLAWEAAHGPIPAGMIVMHRCDNPPCYRLDHLKLGTKRDNTRDMMRKGRRHDNRGTKNGRSALQPADVLAIRASSASALELAEQFNTTRPNIYLIRNRKTWTHI